MNKALTFAKHFVWFMFFGTTFARILWAVVALIAVLWAISPKNPYFG